MTYFDYPAGSDTQTGCSAPTATANRANCGFAVNDLTQVGSYTASASPYGTFDQGGNAFEWNEAIIFGGRGLRGGSLHSGAPDLSAATRYGIGATDHRIDVGFRIAIIPEPGADLLRLTGLSSLLGLVGWRRAHA